MHTCLLQASTPFGPGNCTHPAWQRGIHCRQNFARLCPTATLELADKIAPVDRAAIIIGLSIARFSSWFRRKGLPHGVQLGHPRWVILAPAASQLAGNKARAQDGARVPPELLGGQLQARNLAR